MKQKDIKKGRLYTNGKTVRAVVEIGGFPSPKRVFYASSVNNFCNEELIEQPLKNFAWWAKMECEFELQIEEE